MKIDLNVFCRPSGSSFNLSSPWRVGDYTYATNKHIMVRVTNHNGSRSECTENRPDLEAIFLKMDFSSCDMEIPRFDMPEMNKKVKCDECFGNKKLHDCQSCTCICQNCNGTGLIDNPPDGNVSVTFNGGILDAWYLKLISDNLPDVLFGSGKFRYDPVSFTFLGGCGAIMPILGKYKKHLDLDSGE